MPGHVELLADADRPGGYLMLVDRVRQSYVDLDDPTYLDFEYMQTFAQILDTLRSGPLAVTHIGAGGCTLPRYLAAVRPRSSQIVLEPDGEVIAVLRAQLPLPRGSGIRIRQIDGRRGVAALAAASADVLIVAAFDDGRVPAELSTREFVADVLRVLKQDGVLMMNVADGPPGTYVRRLVATLSEAMPEVMLCADPSVLKRRRFGNIVLAASRVPLPVLELAQAAARAPFPTSVLAGSQLAPLLSGVVPLTDDDAMSSFEPPAATWRVSD